MRPILLAALLVPSLAAAADAPASVGVTGVTTAPLYAALDEADRTVYVAVKSGETTLLFRLATGHDELRVAEGAAKRLGGKVSGKGEKKKATFESWSVGGGTFNDVHAKVVGGDVLRGADGEIGLTAIPGVAWAVLPSKGEVRLTPSTSADTLFAAVGGTKVTYTSVAKKKQKIGKGPKTEIPAAAVVLPVAWSGVAILSRVLLERPQSTVNTEADGTSTWYSIEGATTSPTPLPAAPGRADGASREEWREVNVGGTVVSARVGRPQAGMRAAFDTNARVGADVLGTLDLVIDPATSSIAITRGGARATASFAADPGTVLRKGLEAKPDADEKAKADTRKGGIPALADFARTHGKGDEAVALYKELTTLDAGACTSWLSYGDALLGSGKAAEAIEPLRRASELYAPWAALSLADRKTAEEGKAKAEKKGETWDGATPQDHACHTANGLLAQAHVASGNPAAVASLYPTSLDLDANLALAAGNAALARKDATAAEAAFRQAISMAKRHEPYAARAGLALALAGRDAGLAAAQLSRIAFASDLGTDPRVVRTWLTLEESRSGRNAAVKALVAHAANAPWDAVLAIEVARALGNDAAAWTSAEKALATTEGDARRALTAALLLGQGKVDEARAAAKTALDANGASALAWLVMADVENVAGNTEAAKAASQRAVAASGMHPAWASML